MPVIGLVCFVSRVHPVSQLLEKQVLFDLRPSGIRVYHGRDHVGDLDMSYKAQIEKTTGRGQVVQVDGDKACALIR